MAEKKIGLIIRKSPYTSLEAVEAMRMGVGLTIRNIEVYVFLLEDGLKALEKIGAEKKSAEFIFKKHLETLNELGQTLVAESRPEKIDEEFYRKLNPDIWSRDRIFNFIARCDGVVVV